MLNSLLLRNASGTLLIIINSDKSFEVPGRHLKNIIKKEETAAVSSLGLPFFTARGYMSKYCKSRLPTFTIGPIDRSEAIIVSIH